MLLELSNLGAVGLVKDQEPWGPTFPLNGFTDVRNVAFREGAARKQNGYETLRSVPVEPWALFPAYPATAALWVACGLAKVYAFNDGASGHDITRAGGDYTGGDTDIWNGDMFHGKLILNNGKDYPQFWDDLAVTTKLADLTNWPVDVYCKVMRPYKRFLVALDVVKTGIRDPRLVKWSHMAAPGALPSSWDYTDPALDAGELSLPEGTDRLVDGLPMGNVFIIYGEASIWSMRESGDEYIFAFHRLLDRIGILAQGCVVAIDDATSEFNGKHVIATQNLDIALHDGARVQSLLETRVRKWLFDNINPEYVRLCRLAVRKSKKEVWFAFPYGSSTVLNMALVWHWQTGAFSLQQLPNVMDIAAADYLPGGGEAPDSWDGESALAWEDDDVIWSPPFAPTWRGNFVGDLFMASAVGKAILRVGDGYAPAQESYVERRGICHFPSENGPVAAPELVKLLTSVWPKARGSGVTLRIYVSLRMTPDAAVNWIGPLSFIVGGSAPCVDVYKAGRYIDVKVTDGGGAASEWALEGLALDVSPLGGF